MKKASCENVSAEEHIPKKWKTGYVKLGAEHEGDEFLDLVEELSEVWGIKWVLRRDYELLDRFLPGKGEDYYGVDGEDGDTGG